LLSARCLVEGDAGGDALEEIPFTFTLTLALVDFGAFRIGGRLLPPLEQLPQCPEAHARILSR
jgi:hypothetical protein